TIVVAGVFFANEANYFPRETTLVKSFSEVEKIWSTQNNYLCARGRGGLRCATRPLTPSDVENTIAVPFLSDPTAIVEDAPHVCALEHGKIMCWEMASRILSGLGLVYTPSQEAAGTINHGEIPASATQALPVQGAARSLVAYRSTFCALADDGATCFKYADQESPLPVAIW